MPAAINKVSHVYVYKRIGGSAAVVALGIVYWASDQVTWCNSWIKQNFVFRRHPRWFPMAMLNKGGTSIESHRLYWVHECKQNFSFNNSTRYIKDWVSQFLCTSDYGWDTCRVPGCPWHPSGYLHTSDPGQGTCIPLTLIGVPAYHWYWSGYLHTPDTAQGTCIPLTLLRAPAYPWHCSEHLHTPDTAQSTCIPLTLLRAPAYLWHCSEYLHPSDTAQGTCIPLTLLRAPAYLGHCSEYQRYRVYIAVRSLGSVALRMGQHRQLMEHFNFFSIDFNEELYGFYGGYLHDQTGKFMA